MSSQRDRHSEPVPGVLVRPRYSAGLVLEDGDLNAAVDYGRELNRLLFRSLFGCGVVCGLTVAVETGRELEVTVEPGLALDGCGDPVQLARPVTIGLGRDRVLPDPAAGEPDPKLRNLWVVLRGGEQACAPRQLVADADELDDLAQPTRIRATAQVSILTKRPECLCACGPAPDLGEEDLVAHYDRITVELLGAADPAAHAQCHKGHAERRDCAVDGGCGPGCDCGCPVLLARLHWFKAKGAWGAVHAGERRFVRPTFGPDPIKDQAPAKSAGA